MPMPKDWTRRERTILMLAAIATFTVSTVSLVGSWQANNHLTEYVKCQSQWDTFLYSALTARTNAGTSATAAMDDLIDAVTQAKSANDTRAALAKYKEARANQIQEQKDHPLPPPPDEVCQI